MRRLTREDRELWAALRRTVRPLRPPPEVGSAAAEASGIPREAQPAPAATARPPAKAAARPAAPPPLSGLKERMRRRLSRGLADVDGRIDLHGMRQERAFAALVGFLRQSQLRGARLVLVITGKDRGGEAGGFADKPAGEGWGVLRRSVPGWLSRPDIRELVSGFEDAGRRHGGDGALYVRIRRRGGRLGA